MKHHGSYILTILIVASILLFGTFYLLPTGNRLSSALSPYLRQHANDPVAWQPFGAEALERARVENKPILLSIGYSSCHWCHVMRQRVYSRSEVAEFLNAHFIAIKIDREERPDLDELYMNATYLLHGEGGWPNQVFVTHELKPFFATTYADFDEWMQILKTLSERWKSDRAGVMELADTVTQRLAGKLVARPAEPEVPLSIASAHTFFKYLAQTYDRRYGGFGTGIKFPHELELMFLLAYYRQFHDEYALKMAMESLDHMAAGGLHDQLGGGFHRYATDAQWRVPHFEKMLYTQAMMMRSYAMLYTQARHPYYAQLIENMVAFLSDTMTSSNGAFYAALDADSQGREGGYYLWTHEEIRHLLTPQQLELFTQLYTLVPLVADEGEKKDVPGVLNLRKPLPEAAASMGMLYADLMERVTQMHKPLAKAAGKRKAPHLDQKVITAWNGLMIDALARAGMILEKPELIERAERAMAFILKYNRNHEGVLQRVFMRGKAYQPAFLDDYASLMQALASLYRATNNTSYAETFKQLDAQLAERFADKASAGYYHGAADDGPPLRLRRAEDNETPSGNATLAHAYLDLYEITLDTSWLDKARALIRAFAGQMQQELVNHPHLLHALLRVDALASGEATLAPSAMAESHTRPTASQPTESKDVITLSAVRHEHREGVAKLAITLQMNDPAWHVQANPAAMPSLIPTSIDVQTDTPSQVKVTYPKADSLPTAIGEMTVYNDGAVIEATVTFESAPKADEEMRILGQIQACRETTCLAPSDVVLVLPLNDQ